MKRLFYCAAFALSISFFSSCAQHDPNSPDTSGSLPVDKQGAGVDTSNAGIGPNTSSPNNNNDGTINNQAINTHDSAQQK